MKIVSDNNSLFGTLASDTPQENMDYPQNFAADEVVTIEKPNEKIPSYKWKKKANGKRRTQIRIQITINITENKRTHMMGLSLLILKPN